MYYLPRVRIQKSLQLGLIVSRDPVSNDGTAERSYQLTVMGFRLMVIERSIDDLNLNKGLENVLFLKSHNLVYKANFENLKTEK